MIAAPRRHTPPQAEAGFSLVEMLLVILMVVVLVLVTLRVFDDMNRLTRVQTHLAQLQQSQRVAQNELVRWVRMAGRGGVGEQPVTAGVDSLVPLGVRNNVTGAACEVVAGSGVDAQPESDILTLRGVFTTPVYRVDYVDTAAFNPATRRVVLRDLTPTGLPQDLEPLREAVTAGRREALVLTDALGDAWGVAELDPGSSTLEADRVTLAYRVAGNPRATQFAALSSGGVFPNFTKVLTVGLLEEHRFFVRDGDPVPRLARARTFPGLEEVWQGEVDELVAHDVLDLQVGLGFDSSLAGGFFACDEDTAGSDDEIVEAVDGVDDDWLFNRPRSGGEDAAEVPWTPPPVGGWTALPTLCTDTPQPRLYYVRVATLVRSPRPDPKFEAPVVAELGDRLYGTAADDPINGREARLHRRRILETTVDLRNL